MGQFSVEKGRKEAENEMRYERKRKKEEEKQYHNLSVSEHFIVILSLLCISFYFKVLYYEVIFQHSTGK